MTGLRMVLILGLTGSWSVLAAPVEFNRDIRSILAKNCFSCHGQDAKEGGLDLRTKPSMLKGKAFVSGKTGQRLWRSKHGEATALRFYPLAEGDLVTDWHGLRENLLQHLSPESAGFSFRPVQVRTRMQPERATMGDIHAMKTLQTIPSRARFALNFLKILKFLISRLDDESLPLPVTT